jgi:hypothetical protein
MPADKTDGLRSWIAVAISLLALAISSWTAWTTALRPARIEGGLSYLVIWRFSSKNDGAVTDVALTPAFWLQNVGAQPAIIKDLRMVFTPKDSGRILSFPVSSVPLAAIEASTEFNDYGRISSGSPFRSFSLTPSQLWISSYRFNISADSLRKLLGEVAFQVQVRTKDPEWKTVLSDSLDFGEKPYHLRPMIGAEESIPIYPLRWKLRTQEQ